MAWLLRATLAVCAACDGRPRDGVPHPAWSEAVGSTAEAIQQCAIRTVEGIDVFDGQGAIDWAAVADGGIAFAMIKATQGTYDTQSTFAANWGGAARAGIRRGAYHFFDPTEDGAAQAQHFLSVVGALEAGDLPPMLDVECPDGDADCLGTGASGAAPADAIAQRMWAWIHAVEVGTGRLPLVYTFASYFASSGVDAGGLEAYPLFLAYPTGSACFAVPPPWTEAAMWQYSWTGTVSGVPGDVDRDRFLGSPEVFAAFTGIGLGSSADAAAPGTPVSALDAGSGGASVSPDAGQSAGVSGTGCH